MKLYLIGLIAFATLLGTGCKKDEVKPDQSIKLLKPQYKADLIYDEEVGIEGPGPKPPVGGDCVCGPCPCSNPPPK